MPAGGLLLRPAILVAAFYGVVAVSLLSTHAWDPRFFATVGPQWKRHDPDMRKFADGAIFFDFASDPFRARERYHAFRSWRILYPAVAHVLALGRANLVGWSLLATNLVAIVLGTEVLHCILNRRGLPGWAALAYGAWGGVGLALLHGTCEPLAYLLVIVGIDAQEREHAGPAGMAFLGALLTRETTALIAAPSLLLGRSATEHPPRLVAGGVFAAWGASLWLLGLADPKHSLPGDGRLGFPLVGYAWTRPLEMPATMLYLLIPCAVVIGWAARQLRRRSWDASVCAAMLNAVFVLWLPPLSAMSLWHSGRLSTGFVLAAVMASPLAASAPRFWRALVVLFISSASWTAAVTVRYLLWDTVSW